MVTITMVTGFLPLLLKHGQGINSLYFPRRLEHIIKSIEYLLFLFYSAIALVTGYISFACLVFLLIGVYTNVQLTTSPGGMLLKLCN